MSRRLLALFVVAPLAALAGPAAAITLALSSASLSITAPAGFSPATLNAVWNGTGSADVVGFGSSITSVTDVTAGILSLSGTASGLVAGAFPVTAIFSNLTTGTGQFGSIPGGSTTINATDFLTGGSYSGAGSGTMGLNGNVDMWIPSPSFPGAAHWILPVTQGGVGGGLGGNTAATPAGFKLYGAPFTTGNAYACIAGLPPESCAIPIASGSVGPNSLTLVSPFIIDFSSTEALGSPGFATLTLTFVPEPTTAALLGLGLAGLAAIGRKRLRR